MKYVLITLMAITFSSCYYDNKDDLYDYIVIPGEGGPCETTSMSYMTDITPIVQLQCNLACHNAKDRLGNVVLESYANLKVYVDNGSFLGSIQRSAGYVGMPPNSKLAQCDIDKIQSWINDGYPNN